MNASDVQLLFLYHASPCHCCCVCKSVAASCVEVTRSALLSGLCKLGTCGTSVAVHMTDLEHQDGCLHGKLPVPLHQPVQLRPRLHPFCCLVDAVTDILQLLTLSQPVSKVPSLPDSYSQGAGTPNSNASACTGSYLLCCRHSLSTQCWQTHLDCLKERHMSMHISA